MSQKWIIGLMSLIAFQHTGVNAQVVKPETVGLSSNGLAKINEVVGLHIKAGDIPGAVVLVERKGKVAFWSAYGVADATSQIPLSKDTVFWVASMTKPIVAAALLTLVDDGKVSIDDPVSKYIPEFKLPRLVRTLKPGSPPPKPAGPGPTDSNAAQPVYDYSPAARELTLKDFLTHTSGIQVIGVPNTTVPPIAPGDTVAQWTPKLADSILEFQPGSQWAYSNSVGFDVLVRVVEVASGQAFNTFVQDKIFTPLHMSSSGFHDQRTDLDSRFLPMDARNLANPCIAGSTYFCGSAGLWISADDYAKFAQMLLSEGTAPDGKRVLSAMSVKLMASNQIGNLFPGTQGISGQGAGMGLGVMVVTDHTKAGVAVPDGSFGWDGVGTRRFWVMPSEKLVLVMYMPGGKATQAHRDIEDAVMAARIH